MSINSNAAFVVAVEKGLLSGQRVKVHYTGWLYDPLAVM